MGGHLHHVIAEGRRRGLPYPSFLVKEYLPDFSNDAFTNAVKNTHSVKVVRNIAQTYESVTGNRFLVKYGERVFMERSSRKASY